MSGAKGHLKDEGTRLQVIAAGATAGLISRFVIAPLDVIKIRLQLQSRTSSRLDLRPSTLSTIKLMFATEGITAFWKGNVPAELLYVCYVATQFTAYRSTTLLLRQIFPSSTATASPSPRSSLPPAAESFIAGAVAGAAATAATYPLDLLRTRFAAQGTTRVYPSLLLAVRIIIRDEGTRGLFRGLGPALGQIMPYMGIFFAVYEGARPTLADLRLPFGGGEAAASIVASVIAKTAVFPLDLVRKRIQVQGPTRTRYAYGDALPEYSGGARRALVAILRTEGILGLYRGLTISLIKAAPTSAVTLWTYEKALRVYMDMSSRHRDNV